MVFAALNRSANETGILEHAMCLETATSDIG